MVQLFCVKTNQLEDAEITYDRSTGEYIATFANGHFLKFPKVNSQQELLDLFAKHNEANKPVVLAEAEEAANAEAMSLLEGL